MRSTLPKPTAVRPATKGKRTSKLFLYAFVLIILSPSALVVPWLLSGSEKHRENIKQPVRRSHAAMGDSLHRTDNIEFPREWAQRWPASEADELKRLQSYSVTAELPPRLPPISNASVLHGALEPTCSPLSTDPERAALLDYLLIPQCDARDEAMCAAVRRALAGAPTRQLVLTIARYPEQKELLDAFTTSVSSLRVPTLILLASTVGNGDEVRYANSLESQGLAAVSLAEALPRAFDINLLAAKWSAMSRVLDLNASVLYTDVDTILTHPPFSLLHNDSDVEVLSEGWDEEGARGFIFGSDDPSMGWGRYAESMRLAFLSPSLVYLQPTGPSSKLTYLLTELSRQQKWSTVDGTAWSSSNEIGDGEAKSLTFELAAPAHDNVVRVGASFRVLHTSCWLNGRVAHSRLLEMSSSGKRPAAVLVGRTIRTMHGGAAERAHAVVEHYHRGSSPLGPSWSDVKRALPNRHGIERTRIDPLMGAPLKWSYAKEFALKTKCTSTEPPRNDRGGHMLRRSLHWLAPVDENAVERAPWPINCDTASVGLCEVVKRVAINRAVMASVANRNIAHDHYLGKFTDLVQAANVSNFLVVALDTVTGGYLEKRGVSYYVRSFKTRTGADSSTTDNHATSALKFEILTELLTIGVSVLLSDVDVPIIQNPFGMLYRDADIENMSDGWDDDSVYGLVHPMEVPNDTGHGPLRSLRYETRNSGLMYVAATAEGLRTVKILAKRMASEAVWDQSAWNQETFRAAYDGLPVVGGAYVRVMNYLCVLNTKVLFKYLPKDNVLGDPTQFVPAMAHMNYHPEKEPRMAATIEFYGLQGHPKDANALTAWNGGEGRNTHTCEHKVGVPSNVMPVLTEGALVNFTLGRNLVKAGGAWKWGSSHSDLHHRVYFHANGTFESPFYPGTWGQVPGPWRKDAVHVQLGDETYLVMFLSEKWSFVAVRCRDEQVSYGRLDADPIPEKRLVW